MTLDRPTPAVVPPAGAPRSLLGVPAMRSVVILAVLGFLSFFVTLSSLPVYAVDRGASEALAGLATSAMLVSTVLCQLTVPMLLHRFGTGPVMIIGLIALGAPTPALLLGHGLAPLLAVSVVRGLGFAILTVTLPLVATEVSPRERHGAAIGLYGLAIAVPQLVMVPAGLALTEAGGFAWVAWLGIAPLLALPFLRPLAGRILAAAPDAPIPAVDGLVAAVAVGSDAKPPRTRRGVPGLAAITAVLLTSTVAGGGILTILPVQRPGPSAAWALVAFGITAAVVRWAVGVIADRRGTRSLLAWGIVGNVLGLAVVAIGAGSDGTSGDVLVVLGAFVFGCGYGAVQNLTLLIGFAIAGAQRARASAVWNASFDLGTAIGALLVGTLAAWTDLPVAVLVCIALIAATAVPGLRVARLAARDESHAPGARAS